MPNASSAFDVDEEFEHVMVEADDEEYLEKLHRSKKQKMTFEAEMDGSLKSVNVYPPDSKDSACTSILQLSKMVLEF